MSDLLMLFLEFFKTGLFSVGGGLATLPFLYEISDNNGWFTHTDIADMIAVSESTPGAIGINMSTYAGYKAFGIPGGIVATLSLALPSLIIIVIIAKVLQKFKDNAHVKKAFYGLRPASIAMISAAGINVAKVALVNVSAFSGLASISDVILWKGWILAIAIYLCNLKFKIHPVFYILIAAVVGVVFRF